MDTSLILVLLLSPFVGFLFNVFLGKKAGKSIVGIMGTLSVVVSFAVTIYFFLQINQTKQAIEINLFDWISTQRFNINLAFF